MHGWHRGERIIHEKLGQTRDPGVSRLYSIIDGDLQADHGKFHSTYLPFVPLSSLDREGRPWGSILAAANGKPGFIKFPRYSTLSINATLWDGEPLARNSREDPGGMLVAGIGVDYSNRRRNKFAGKISRFQKTETEIKLDITVNESLGNCPKYITVRDLIPQQRRSPHIALENLHLSSSDSLPVQVISQITNADTVFLGTTYAASSDESRLFPSHLGMNQRGGPPGFIRVSPSDKRTIVMPDFSGNRLMTSLGNIEATPFASLTFVSFTTGDILYITGDAKNLTGPSAQAIMPLQNTLTTVYATGFTLVKDALPVRQRPGTTPEPSPYNPPIRLLAEEAQSTLFSDTKRVAQLTRIKVHGPSIASFTWETSKPLSTEPGQAIIMDFSSVLGARRYQHMAPSQPTAINDDKIRTWTISSISDDACSFTVTLRAKPSGLVTGALFSIAKKLAQLKPEVLDDCRPLQLSVRIVGVVGDFTLPRLATQAQAVPITPRIAESEAGPPKMLWIAGGVGFTPFLRMLEYLAHSEPKSLWHINLVLSTREPDILISLICKALSTAHARQVVRLSLDVFSTNDISDLDAESSATISLQKHSGRLTPAFFSNWDLRLEEYVFLCGPKDFENMVVEALTGSGLPSERLRRENFEY